MSKKRNGSRRPAERDFNSVQWKPSLEDVERFNEYERSEEVGFESLAKVCESNGVAVRYKPPVAGRYPTVSITGCDPDSKDYSRNVWWYVSGYDKVCTSVQWFLEFIGISEVYKSDTTEILL